MDFCCLGYWNCNRLYNGQESSNDGNASNGLLFNGMGGACAALISVIEYTHMQHVTEVSAPSDSGKMIIILAGLIIGSVSFAGSMIAYGKLEED